MNSVKRGKETMRIVMFGLCGVVSAAAVVVGCDRPLPRPEPTPRSTKVVTLPASPELKVKPYTSRHADGTLTVEGLLRERDTHIGTTVTVRGVVKGLVQCAPIPQTLPEGSPPDAPVPPPVVPESCSPPQHVVIEDKAGNPKWQLTAYGSMKSELGRLALGQEATLTGTFDMVSPDGVFLRQGGLLLLADLPAPEPTPEPVAPTP